MPTTNPVLDEIKASLAKLDKPQVAHVGREILQLLAAVVEDVPTNAIVHMGEVYVFGQLDALLAKMEQPVIVPNAS